MTNYTFIIEGMGYWIPETILLEYISMQRHVPSMIYALFAGFMGNTILVSSA